jgi:hypothetical protein
LAVGKRGTQRIRFGRLRNLVASS